MVEKGVPEVTGAEEEGAAGKGVWTTVLWCGRIGVGCSGKNSQGKGMRV